MKHAKSLRTMLGNLCIMAVACNFLLRPGTVWAGAPRLDSGQLSFAREVTVNGGTATAGQTIFTGNRIKVGSRGTAIINLGKLGRIELGADSDFIFRLSNNVIGGDLNYGCMIIISSEDAEVLVNVGNGKITSDGKQSSSASIGHRGNTSNVAPYLGEISVASGGLVENAKPGDLITWTDGTRAEDKLRRRSISECGERGVSCFCYDSAGTNNKLPNKPGGNGAFLLPVLFAAVLAASAGIFFGIANNDNGQGLTCVNSTGIFCRPVSPSRP